MSEYVYLGTQPYQADGLRVEPSLEGTPFTAKFDPEREKDLLARGLIRVVTPSPKAKATKRGKG